MSYPHCATAWFCGGLGLGMTRPFLKMECVSFRTRSGGISLNKSLVRCKKNIPKPANSSNVIPALWPPPFWLGLKTTNDIFCKALYDKYLPFTKSEAWYAGRFLPPVGMTGPFLEKGGCHSEREAEESPGITALSVVK